MSAKDDYTYLILRTIKKTFVSEMIIDIRNQMNEK